MSGFTGFKQRQKEHVPAEIQRDPRACYCHGCINFGTVELDGGRKFCSFHAWAPSEDWSRITTELRNHRWLMDLMQDVKNAKLDSEWVPLATAFWQDEDPYMVPTESERSRPHDYWTRLHGELMYRVGARNRRPKPIEPAQIQKRKVSGWSGF